MSPAPLASAALLALAACTPLNANVPRADADAPCGPCPPGRACVAGRCSTTACVEGRADCDGVADNGCEVSTAADARHCGACGRACALPGATAVCAAGACRVGACDARRGDCDGDGANGCERDLDVDPAHCGRCGASCAAPHRTATCAAGSCAAPTCERGFADCDGAAANGCEADTRADLAHCGACDAPCPAPARGAAACSSGACTSACDAGFDRSTGACLPPGAPRLVAPLSASAVGPRPTLRWALGANSDGARVTLCRDRAMTDACRAHDAAGGSLRAPEALARGRWFWRATGRRGATALASSVTWSLVVGARNSPDEGCAAPVADFDGDGFDDVAIGAPNAGLGPTRYAGAWSLFPGSAAGLPTAPTRVAAGVFGRDLLGRTLAAGDFDGDAVADLAVGAPAGADGESSRPGAFRVYRSGAAGVAGAFEARPGPTPAYGNALAALGDVNGDGVGDLAVGGSLRRDGPVAVSVFWGGAAGVGATPSQVIREAGTSLSGAADLQRDGFADLVVGVSGADPGGRTDAGTFAVYVGSAAGLAPSAVLRADGEAAGDRLGESVAMLGDTDGDGLDDFAVGAPGAGGGAGRALVYAGRPGAAALARTLDGAAGEGFGACVARVGDVNGDGYADLAVGAPEALGERGRVALFLGGAAGIGATPARVWEGDVARAGFGELVAGLGDVNGDGYADLALAARGAGRVWVFAGAADGPGATATWVLTGTQRDDGFGTAVARAPRRAPPGRAS